MFVLSDTTTSESTTEDNSSSTESSDLNCTVVIPVCSPSPPLTTLDPDQYPSTTESLDSTSLRIDDVNITLNGTGWEENATITSPCRGFLDEDAPCPEKCRGEKPRRMPTQEDLLGIPEATKEVLRKKCWETAFGQVEIFCIFLLKFRFCRIILLLIHSVCKG